MDKSQIDKYQDFARQKLGFEYKNIELLITALTHRSYVNEHRKTVKHHNERLEFLGDAVLELTTTDYLFHNYSEPEGILTNWRAALVCTESIGEAGKELDYEPLVRMSRGEKKGSDRARAQILANAFEAVLGSIYLEKGYVAADEFVKKHIIVKLPQIIKSGSWHDSKSYLQEMVQKYDGNTPQYHLLSESGPDHDKAFTVGVFSEKKMIGKGTGPSKHTAEQEAARVALDIYKDKIDSQKD